MKKMFIVVVLIQLAVFCWSGGAAEGGGSNPADAIAGQGRIVPASEINISSYIAQLDYDYPLPEKDLGITFITDTDSFPQDGSEVLLQIGIQGEKIALDKLPPLNLCFLFDLSGSMAGPDMITKSISAVKKACSVLRPQDTVSIVSNQTDTPVLFSPAKIDTAAIQQVNDICSRLSAEGDMGISAALGKAFQVCLDSAGSDSINRVVLFSDGNFPAEDCLDTAAEYRGKGVTLTTIGVGLEYKSECMMDLATSGGGSSRFIATDKHIQKHFADEIERMLVPVAFDVEMELEFDFPCRDVRTWGYEYKKEGKTIRYTLPSLHNGDYETILAGVYFPKTKEKGLVEAARFTLAYTNTDGKRIKHGPLIIKLNNSPDSSGLHTPTDPRMLQSSLMLNFAGNLIAVAEIYDDVDFISNLNNRLYHYSFNSPKSARQPELPDVKRENRERSEMIALHYERMLDYVLETYVLVGQAEMQLGKPLFAREKRILDSYINIICRNLSYSPPAESQFKSGSYLRAEAEGMDLDDAAGRIVPAVLKNLPKGSEILFPGLIGRKSPDTEKKIAVYIKKQGCRYIPILPATIPDDYRSNTAAAMAGKAVSGTYVLLLLAVENETGSVLYTRLVDVKTGKIIETDKQDIN